MAIWDVIGTSGEASEKFEKFFGINSTWSTVLGDSIANIIGGGRFTNIFGTDAKIVFDWEEMLIHYLGSKLGGHDNQAPSGSPGLMPNKLMGALFGIGGDTSLVFGNKTSFSYFGEDCSPNIGRKKIDANFNFPDLVKQEEMSVETNKLYYLPMYVALAGVLVMTAITLCLKYICKFSSSNPWYVEMGGED